MAPTDGLEPPNAESESAVLPIRLSGYMAAPTGFEPVNKGVKVLRLAAWPRGYIINFVLLF